MPERSQSQQLASMAVVCSVTKQTLLANVAFIFLSLKDNKCMLFSELCKRFLPTPFANDTQFLKCVHTRVCAQWLQEELAFYYSLFL